MWPRDAAYPEDSVVCCVLPHKCRAYHRTPAAVAFSDTVWYLNVAFVACCLARIVWAALRTAHRYIKFQNDVMCRHAAGLDDDRADPATGDEDPNGTWDDAPASGNESRSATSRTVGRNVVAETSVKYDAADVTSVTSAESMVAVTDLEHGRSGADDDARRRNNTPSRSSEQDSDTSRLTDGTRPDSADNVTSAGSTVAAVPDSEHGRADAGALGRRNTRSQVLEQDMSRLAGGRQPDSCCSSDSVEQLIDENCCGDEKECCGFEWDLNNDASTANDERCYIKNHDMKICPKINNRIYPTFKANEFFGLIHYK